MLSSLDCLDVSNFFRISDKWHDFRKIMSFFYAVYSKHFSFYEDLSEI
jgi:hypothetical protein